MSLSKKQWVFIKALVFILCLAPFLVVLKDAIQDQLGANPVETLHFRLGDLALQFLCIGLALTPLKKIFHQSWLIRFRRMMGLYVFFYASMHLLVFIVLDLSLSWEAFVDEVPKSPYILAGLFTYIILTPLALTSTKSMQKRLGKNWVKLHKLVYVAGISAVVHYLWLVKSIMAEAIIYAGIMFLLLAYRAFDAISNRIILFRQKKNSLVSD